MRTKFNYCRSRINEIEFDLAIIQSMIDEHGDKPPLLKRLAALEDELMELCLLGDEDE